MYEQWYEEHGAKDADFGFASDFEVFALVSSASRSPQSFLLSDDRSVVEFLRRVYAYQSSLS